jgi:IS5 family transposase
MREKIQKQLPLMNPAADHDQARELEAIDAILKKHPTICDLVYQDLCANRCVNTRNGARGMSAEQVLRAAILKALFGFTYKELAFHLVDSRTLRRFCLIGFTDKGFKKSVLNKNIKALSADSWEQINRQLMGQAAAEKTEKAREVRIDCTVVETNIHAPTDSSLLFDAVRVLTRLLHAAKKASGLKNIGRTIAGGQSAECLASSTPAKSGSVNPATGTCSRLPVIRSATVAVRSLGSKRTASIPNFFQLRNSCGIMAIWARRSSRKPSDG